MRFDVTSLNRAWDRVISDRNLLIWTFLTAVLVYGFEISSFTLSIDEETHALLDIPAYFVALGRWGLVLLQKTIFPHPFVPFFTPLLTVFFLCAAAYVLQGALQLCRAERWIFCILFVSFPQFAYQMQFSIQSDCVAFGLFCVALSFVCLQRFLRFGQWLWAVPLIGLNIFAISIYQALLFVLPVLCILWSLAKLTSETQFDIRADLRGYCFYLLFAVVSLGLYVTLSRLALRALQLTAHSYLFSSVGWVHRPFAENLLDVGQSLLRHFSGQSYYGETLFVSLLVPVAGLVIFLCRRYRGGVRVWALAIIAALLVSPFLQILLFGQAQEARTLLAQGMLLGAVWALAHRVYPLGNHLVCCMLAGAVLLSAVQVNRLFYGDYVRWQTDMLLANRIISSIYVQEPAFDAAKMPVYLHGRAQVPPPMVSGAGTFGSSFFTHDGGNLIRMLAFMRLHGMDVWPAPKDKILALLPRVDTMPRWPAPGSIAMIDGVLTIKLNNYIGGYIGE